MNTFYSAEVCLQNCLARLDKSCTDPLLKLNEKIDWEDFRDLLQRVRKTERKNSAGAPGKDVVMMFKGLILQNIYGLSDGQLEFHIEDRLSFRRFLGLSFRDRAPDCNTFWTFRESIKKLGLMKSLFERFAERLSQQGLTARKGHIVDASIIACPKQRNSKKENEQIKNGTRPENWSTAKAQQKDTDARWTQKNGTNHFGYKNHINIDRKHKIIRNYDVTAASVHDSQTFVGLVDNAENTNKSIWADSAYRGGSLEQTLKEKGYRLHIQRKGYRNHPLSDWEKQGNKTRARVRARVEHVFGTQSQWGNTLIRTIGIARAKVCIGLRNLGYNMQRLCFLT